MEELDLLKKDWKREDAFSQVSESEIYKMLHKRSSSIVKWIFIVSIGELALGFLIGILSSYTKYDDESLNLIQKWGLYDLYIGVNVILYIVIFYFIYRFYTMYRRISAVESTKKLIASILKTRKVVKQYIAFNLTAFALIFIVFGTYALYHNYLALKLQNGFETPEVPLKLMVEGILILIAIAAVLTLAFWAIYRLAYGLLLKKLYRNYEELKKIDL